MRIAYIVLVFVLPIVFTTQMVMYDRLFLWKKSFQGRALIGQMLALNLVLWVNAVFMALSLFGVYPRDWWRAIAVALYVVLAFAGSWFCGAIARSREKPKKIHPERSGNVNGNQHRS